MTIITIITNMHIPTTMQASLQLQFVYFCSGLYLNPSLVADSSLYVSTLEVLNYPYMTFY